MPIGTTNRAHGFNWPSGLPPCAMCGRKANDQIHVNPHRGASSGGSLMPIPRGIGGSQYAALDKNKNKRLPVMAHAYMLSSPAITASITCQTCGQQLRDGIHTAGLPSGMVPLSSNSGLYGSGLTSTFAKQSAFVAEVNNRVVLATPVTAKFGDSQLPRELAAQWEQARNDNPFFMWIAGRYVEADTPNRNSAYWSTADLEIGQPTVTHGPINWLHEEKHIIGAIAGSQMVHVPGDHQTADLDIGNHIVMLGAIWSHIYPQEAQIIQRASDDEKLWASMECVSKEVACLVCQTAMTYAAYMGQDDRCEHMKAGAPRRFVDPIFGGAGIIVPPVRPGWANAQVQVITPEATGLAERQAAAFGGMTTTEAEALVAQILTSVGDENYVITDAEQFLRPGGNVSASPIGRH